MAADRRRGGRTGGRRRRRRGALPDRDHRRAEGRGPAGRAGADRVRRRRRLARGGVPGPGGPRPTLRLERHGRGHAPHPGGLPGAPRAQRGAAGLPPGARRAPVPAGLGHHRGRHRRRRALQHLRPRGGRRPLPGREAGPGDLLRRRRRRRAGDGPADGRQPRERPGDRPVPPARPRAGAGGRVERPGVPWHLQHGVHPACHRRRRRRARRALRRHLDPDHAADGPPPVVVGVAGDRLRRRRPGPAVRPGRGPAQARHHAAGRPAAGRGDGGPPAVRRHGAVVAGPLSPRPAPTPTACRRSGSAWG